MKTGKVYMNDNFEIEYELNVETSADGPWQKFVEGKDSLELLRKLTIAAHYLQLQVALSKTAAILLDAGELAKTPKIASILSYGDGTQIEAFGFFPAQETVYYRPLHWRFKESIEALDIPTLLANTNKADHGQIFLDLGIINKNRK